MKVTIWKTHSYGRKLRERDMLAAGVSLSGDLSYSTTAKVSSLTLQAIDVQNGAGRLAVLYEPVLVALAGNRMTFRGIEALDRAGVVQGWIVEVH